MASRKPSKPIPPRPKPRMQVWKCPTCPASVDVLPAADMVGHKCPNKSHLPRDRQASWFVRQES